MAAEAVISYLKQCGGKEKLKVRLAIQCAPVLKGVKSSNLVTVKSGEWQQVREWLRKSRVICTLLYADGKNEVLFLYRYEKLLDYLRRPEVRGFLHENGYVQTLCEIAPVLRRLRFRYQQYAGGGREFPHELGVLLEYPVEDVNGFMEKKGRDYLASGYWKVYGDREEAQRRFQRYDEAKKQALEEIMAGKPLDLVAVS